MKLRLKEVPYVGHLITSDGLKPDPEKVKAVKEMPNPTDVAGVRRLIGFVNYLNKFMPKLSDACEPLRKLTLQDTEWCWLTQHDETMDKIKELVTTTPVLKYYDLDEELTLQCDASQTGLRGAILQNGQPAYTSRALTDTETRYAQIEKELLAVVFGLQKFHQYTYGRKVTVHTDHKPLESIFKKTLHTAPKRLQRMLLQLQTYDIEVIYHPGREMYLADTLSRAYLSGHTPNKFESELESVNMMKNMPISEPRLKDIQRHTAGDETLCLLKQVIQQGWPQSKKEVHTQVLAYFDIRDELSVQNGIIFRGERAVVPKELRLDMTRRIHSSHIGIEGCLRRARECLYWPGMSAQVKDYIERCETCRTYDNKQQKETLTPHETPDRPWAKVAFDLFEFDNRNYLVTVDYYSNFWEVDYLENTKSRTVIHKLKSQFARHGIPDSCMADNGPQISSQEFTQFSKDWGFEMTTSSPGYPQSNGKAEQAVKTVKRLMKRAKKSNSDPYFAMLDFRNTPTQEIGSSPAQRLMNRRTKTLLPTKASLLKPKIVDNDKTMTQLEKAKDRQASYYNIGARDLPPLQERDVVRVIPRQGETNWRKATVTGQANIRSYDVLTEDGGQYRRNRRHLRQTKEMFSPPGDDQAELTEQPTTMPTDKHFQDAPISDVPVLVPKPPEPTRSSGRRVSRPVRLDDYVCEL
jgi:hypothetical protein